MTDQATVDYFAKAVKPRLMELLRLKVRHIHELTPGIGGSRLVVDGAEVVFKSVRTTQPYKHIERFAADDKVIGFIVNPGLLPIVKAITMDLRGKSMLITRRIEDTANERGVAAHVDQFGIRLVMSFNPALDESQVAWEAVYAVA